MSLTVLLPSRFEAVPGFLAKAVEFLQNRTPADTEEIFHLRLALEEALTNAIKHGNQLNPTLRVSVAVLFKGGNVLMTVEDKGKGFDDTRVPDPTAGMRVLKTSGRGVFLIKNVMDEVRFSRGGRKIRMVKKLKHRVGPAGKKGGRNKR